MSQVRGHQASPLFTRTTLAIVIPIFGPWPGGLYALATGFVVGYLLAPPFTAERPILS